MPPADRPETPHPTSALPVRRWLARFGVAGFLFFLVKGLLWLAAPTLLVALGIGC